MLNRLLSILDNPDHPDAVISFILVATILEDMLVTPGTQGL